MSRNNKYKSREWVIAGIFLSVSLVFVIRLFKLQVLDTDYKVSSDNNVLRYITLYPARGNVYDRKGTLLVYNEAVYDLMVVPREAKQIDTMVLCDLLRITPENFCERMDKAKNYSRIKASVFLSQVSKEDYAHVAEVIYKFPGFYFQNRTIRHYPLPIAAHTLGDIGEVDQKQIDKDNYYKAGDYVGKSGIEKSYENELRGKKGLKISMVDVNNSEVGSYLDGALDTLPVVGKDINLGLDADLQAYGESLMQGKKGSIVAIEPSTGQILAFVSSPSYDPNMLVGRERGKNYAILADDKDKPLINRTVSGTYPPGSTFKMVIGMVALQTGSIVPSTTFHCGGRGSTPIKCTHSHGSSPDLSNAIENSCNPYFYEAFRATINNKKYGGVKKGYENWVSMVNKLGLGKKFNTDIPSELAGNIPTREFYDHIYGGRWNHLTIRSLGIGQGEVLVTPLQLANIAAIVANEGYYYPPHLINSFADGTPIPEVMTTRVETGIEPRYCKIIKQDMRNVFEGAHGTAHRSRIDSISSGGKTGTAQNPHGEDHSIFIAFAPVENPKIAMSIIIENGGYGSRWAAPIASLMMEKYIRGYTKRPELEKRMMEGKIDYPIKPKKK